MQEPEHVAGARHDDFLRTLYALQEDSRSLFADQPVFLGSEDQRGDVDLLQQRCIVRPNLTAEIFAEIRRDRLSQRDVVQFLRRCQTRGDNFTIVEPKLGHAIEVQFKEVHLVSSPVPGAADGARGAQWVRRVRRKTNLLLHFALRGSIGCFTGPDTAAGQIPFGPVR
jgi:hypothetical protein